MSSLTQLFTCSYVYQIKCTAGLMCAPICVTSNFEILIMYSLKSPLSRTGKSLPSFINLFKYFLNTFFNAHRFLPAQYLWGNDGSPLLVHGVQGWLPASNSQLQGEGCHLPSLVIVSEIGLDPNQANESHPWAIVRTVRTQPLISGHCSLELLLL